MKNRTIAICLEDCYPENENMRFIQCQILQQKGIFIHLDGSVDAHAQTPSWCGLHLTADDRLAALRAPGMESGARVHRGARHTDLKEGKPVILLDGDFLAVPGRCYQIHVHGIVKQPENRPHASAWARAAVLGVVAAAGLAAGCAPREANVSERPRDADNRALPRPEPPKEKESKSKQPPIDVRHEPPVIAVPDEPDEPPAPPTH